MERRRVRRIPVSGAVRVRAAGSHGEGIPCRVGDSSRAGIRLHCEQPVDPDWGRLEVLKASGEPLDQPLELRVVRSTTDRHGCHELGCTFD